MIGNKIIIEIEIRCQTCPRKFFLRADKNGLRDDSFNILHFLSEAASHKVRCAKLKKEEVSNV